MANALAFQTLTEDDFNDIEQFARRDLIDIVQTKAQDRNINLSEETLVAYFGGFASAPANFLFSLEEKQQIQKCIKHIQYKLDLEGTTKGLAYFNIQDNVELTTHPQSVTTVQASAEKPDPVSLTHTILKMLLRTADQNLTRKKEGYRFDKNIQKLATYLRMTGGAYTYETLQKNLQLCLPSLSSTNRYIRRRENNIVEGVLRAQELADYLKARNLCPFVALSEDATRITGQVQYDTKTNELLGFVLPIDDETGMPIPHSYKARSADEILRHFVSETPVGHNINVIMAQPLARVSPFCLLIFSTDSSYTAENIADRWDFITTELQKVGVTVFSISSDSEPKQNSAMRKNSNLGKTSYIFGKRNWFNCGSVIEFPFYIQDLIHIATKLRNFLLKTLFAPDLLPFGKKYFIRISHLKYLIDHFTKDEHELVDSVLDPDDRQNYLSVERMCSEKVIRLLKTHVKNSLGTVTFLEVLRDTVASYLDKKLSPIERIRKSWYALFVIRLWREYVLKLPKSTLEKNFITANCYSCIELNAHSLVLILLYLKEKDMPELFMPHLFTSQVCEETFRQIRSFTTVYSTVANCSAKEIIGRLDKIQLQNDITLESIFMFPRTKSQPTENDAMPKLPTKDEICQEIERCKDDAIAFATKIGLIRTDNKMTCGVKAYKLSDWYNLPEGKINRPLPAFAHIKLKDYSAQMKDEKIEETSPYVELHCINKRMIVKKTSLCWLLRTDACKLSSDRLVRVRTKIIKRSNLKKKSVRRYKMIKSDK